MVYFYDMKSSKDEYLLNIIKKRISTLSEKVLIVSKPERANFFLIKAKNQAKETKNNYQKLIKQVKLYKHLTHEVSNLFDNYYIVDSTISDILNLKIDKDLKKLVQIEKSAGVFIPRIYFLLSELLKPSKNKIDQDILRYFLETYQSKAHLSIRELNYIPLFLKLSLIENINKVIYEAIISLNEYKDANFWFEQIVKKVKGESNPDFSKITSNLTSRYGVIPVNLSFYLLQKLSQYGPDTRPIVKWLKLNLLKRGINISDLAEIENNRQDVVSKQISNIIESLRWINQIRWDDFVTSVNIVDSFLSKDPSSVYVNLDKDSQSVYRNEIVKISDRSGIQESEVVKIALTLCRQSVKTSVNNENHIGYYLLGAGREYFERKLNYKKTVLEKIQAFVLKHSTTVYLGSIFILNIILSLVFFFILPKNTPSWSAYIIGGVIFILSLDISINLIHIIINFLLPVRSLSRLDLSAGLSKDQATFVVVPSMFRDIKSAKDLIRRLEINFLGNTNTNLYYALLMDFKDAKVESLSTDPSLVAEIQKGIEELNQKYPSVVKRFYLFHRRRLFNPQEGVFMGWERKRGKLREFNLLLRNTRETSYIEGLPTDLPHIKYILTIDEDTRLPADSAAKLVGCIDHPFNRPVLDPITHQVISGYGIIQPRMTSKFSSGQATLFSRLFSNAVGIDSYSNPVADIYQDLFNNSIFYGKGIYDVDTMEEVVGDYIPENQVLSHDLLEGIYTRVGFATDIILFEGFPESYKEYILRMHRWIRGDWQIVSWLKFDKNKNNYFSLSDKWKIFDNLRRSTIPVFILIFLFLSYFSFTDHQFYSLLFSSFIIGSAFVISYLFDIFRWPKDMNVLMKFKTLFNGLDSILLQISYRFIFLLDQAIISFRAIIISIYRSVFSRKNLLCWQNSHEVSKNLKGTLREFIYLMLPAEIISLILLIILFIYHHNFYAYLIVIFWFVAPVVAYKISQKDKIFSYKNKDLFLLRKIACRSARFFLELSTKEGNKLIPDHFQEKPIINSPVATSPTNIGMHLLSNMSSFDLGYLGFSAFGNKTKESLEALDSLERYNGHFYNWYDVRSMQPINPKYVSSVDSANFLMNLIVLKQGVLDIIQKPIINDKTVSGLEDIFAVFLDDANLILKNRNVSKLDKRLAKNICREIDIINNVYLVDIKQDSIESISRLLDNLSNINENIKKIISHFDPNKNKEVISSIYSSAEHLNNLLKQKIDDLNIFMSYHQMRKTRPIIHNKIQNKDLAGKLDLIYQTIDTIPSLEKLLLLKQEIQNIGFEELVDNTNITNEDRENIKKWYSELLAKLNISHNISLEYQGKYLEIISLTDKFFNEADFSFLYNKERGLFHIGYNVSLDRIDNSYYDFLASEANSISFVSIIKRQIPVKHWSYLGRKLVRLDMNSVLLSSWGGSLFEYLTSLIFFKVHKESLLGKTAKLAIKAHLKYGQKKNIPWGMGESAFSALDLNNNYQYQIFGHPDLGFRRDLKDFLVIAPYTTIMSLAFIPNKALANLRRMIKKDFMGRYGFYDAVDYTKDFKKNKYNKKANIAKIYYAHHQGFSLQSLNNQINNDRIYSLFSKDTRVESLDTLWEERMPGSVPEKPVKHIDELQTKYINTKKEDTLLKQFIPTHTSYPRKAFISNGRYFVGISNTGSGYSKVNDIYLNRFRNDSLTEDLGQFIYIYDLNKKITWSPTMKPTNISGSKNKIEYFENKASFNKIFNEIESSLLVSIAPDSNTEFRCLTLTNHSKDIKDLKIGSYGEVSMSSYEDDLHHPAFEKLFIKSEFLSKQKALVYTRHNKQDRENKIYFAHKMIVVNKKKSGVSYTTDRNQFLSRGGNISHSDSFSSSLQKIKPNLGYNFDPIFSLQTEIQLKPNEIVNLIYLNTFGNSKDEILKNLKKYSVSKNINQAIKKSDDLGNEIINIIGLSQEQALNYQALASRLLSPHYSPLGKKEHSVHSEPDVQSLWRIGLAGDLPILLVRFYDMTDLALVKNMLLCHRYLKQKGIAHDLVLLNEYPTSYIKSFEDEVDFLIRYNQPPLNKTVRGSIFHLKSSHMDIYDKENLIDLAQIMIDGQLGNIEQQILTILQSDHNINSDNFKAIKKITSSGRDISPDLDHLRFFNGLGGFSPSDREYIMNINYTKGLETKAPWVNIISNKDIGFVFTESGSSYTWLFDSYDNRLTNRIDDPLIDRSSEVFYLRDEETGDFWCPTPLPIKNNHTYTVTHGLGYSRIFHKSRGIEQELLTYVPVTDTVKIIKFKFKNTNKMVKKLSLFGLFEMSLGGPNREQVKSHLYTFKDTETSSIIIKNTYNEAFKNVFAFVDFNAGDSLISNDRGEFIGRNNSVDDPIIMKRNKISNTISTNVDHCISAQTLFELQPGEEKEIVVLLGGDICLDKVHGLIKKYRNSAVLALSLLEVKRQWDSYLNKIQIKTPDESLNILFNERLIYQLMTSRLLARTGYYQPSGAYGFRDQLQDSVALIWSNPDLTKEIILKVASHQFLEGDVQNWWHDHNNFGIRTVFSDQQIWLPYVMSLYLDITKDLSILDHKEPYIKAPLLDFINNTQWAGVPEVDENTYSLYDHCLRAIEKTLVFGPKGLPLMGKNDWNDGLNLVGNKGQGESVWLGWFLYFTLDQFIPYIESKGQMDIAKRYRIIMDNLREILDKKAWDGQWYKRAFFDNGSPLGSKSNKEFKIDSISQSWAVLSGAGKEDRIRLAMNAVYKNLFQDENLLLLISPALKDSALDPGYIKDYPPGVRENGAQYNHATLWAVQAFATLGETEKANKILDSVNPIKRSDTRNKTSLYVVEPYVIASDIYAKPAQAGRGGWTWYTGSAGVMYRTILEYILGLKIRGNKLEINPCVPKDWKEFFVIYTYKNTKYNIQVKNTSGLNSHIIYDGIVLSDKMIYLIDDQKDHKIEIR
jgi:cyclic beta-1,2-glucan synthetase